MPHRPVTRFEQCFTVGTAMLFALGVVSGLYGLVG